MRNFYENLRNKLLQNKGVVSILLPLVLLSAFLWLVFVGMREHSWSWIFLDETEHLTLGWMLVNFDTRLYESLSTNHQPLPVFFGSILSLLPFNSLYQLIGRVRMSMFLFSACSAFLLTIRFKYSGLVAAIVVQSVSYFFFLWYVLAESLVWPAIVFLILLLLEKVMIATDVKAKKTSQKFVYVDAFLAGVSLFWSAFNLLPLWPALVFITLLFLVLETNWRARLVTVVTVLGATCLLVFFFSPFDWYRETVYSIYKYWLPLVQQPPGDYIKALLLPITAFTQLSTTLGRFYAVQVSLISIGLFYTLQRIPKAKKWHALLGYGCIVLIVLLLNNRVTQVTASFYTGFHLVPFIAGLAALAGYFVVQLTRVAQRSVSLVLLLLFVTVMGSTVAWVNEDKDTFSEYFIQYGDSDSYGTAIKLLSQPGDTLLTGADGQGYLHILSGVPLFGRQNFHLEWSYTVPEQRAYFEQQLLQAPPSFVYFKPGSSSYYSLLEPVLAEQYVKVTRADGSETLLHLHRRVVERTPDSLWEEFSRLVFEVPQLEK